MPAPDLTPDPIAARLGRFTADAAGLDRDALMFRAGSASARPSVVWKWAVGVLALTQAATLAWVALRPPVVVGPPAAVAPAPHAEPEEIHPFPASPAPAANSLLVLRQRWELSGEVPAPAMGGEAGPARVPLTPRTDPSLVDS